PPFAENPFLRFGIDKLTDPTEKVEKVRVFTPEQEAAFFAACDGWQKAVFSVLAGYGLRVGELTHLLVEDVDLANGSFVIRSNPWLHWTVKAGGERWLPLLPGTREVFEEAIGNRRSGFIFLVREFVAGRRQPAWTFASPAAFRARAEEVVTDLLAAD